MNIDLQGSGGTTSTAATGAVFQPSGRWWNVNGEGDGVEVPLVTSEGAPLLATLWTDGFTGAMTGGDALYSDYLVGSVELRGLDPNQPYDLVLYSAANIVTLFRLDGPWVLTAESASPSIPCTYGAPALPGVEGCNYFRGSATTNESGVIAIHANLGAIAGLQLDLPAVANPEPTVLLLNTIAITLGLMRRRRR